MRQKDRKKDRGMIRTNTKRQMETEDETFYLGSNNEIEEVFKAQGRYYIVQSEPWPSNL